ncbi:MAG: protein-L-isoaspartate(D-aspartate) O-methyltransferase [Thermoguttaceae bacterium]|jgi:protein-L-isoaspartate(D-aspartate) O-methyltransferase|nr:protein-L-isoaspartate(D-aspartate) O-methyltransferase [Thermoguttaceae bacterium]
MESTLRPTRARLLVLGLLAFVAGLAVFSGGLIVWPSKMLESDAEDVAQAAQPPSEPAAQADQPAATAEPEVYVQRRRDMVEYQLRARDITDPRVLEVMGRVPRHRFVSEEQQRRAYEDHPLPIGHDQTISQPYIVALMTQLAAPKPGDRALDIGTGSGYQAAILAELCKEVYSIEIVQPLAETAKKRLAQLGYRNITVRSGDGYRGWPEHAPFDVIVLAAAPNHVPQPLIDQLAPGGRLVLPVGGYPQQLTLITKQADGTVRRRTIAPVMFVPMTGEAQRQRKGPADEKRSNPGQDNNL